MYQPLPILYEDQQALIVNKPAGLLVHRTGISEDRVFVMQLLRNQVGYHVFPVHRLDRGVSGVLVFGKTAEAAKTLQNELQAEGTCKQYLAIARGHLPEEGRIDRPLDNAHSGGEPKEALTEYKTLAYTEMPWAIGRYPQSRYSLVQLRPFTGRTHQLRRHLAHLRHPIIGDKVYGDLHHNGYFWNLMGQRRILLHARSLTIQRAGITLTVDAPLPTDFEEMVRLLFPKSVHHIRNCEPNSTM